MVIIFTNLSKCVQLVSFRSTLKAYWLPWRSYYYTWLVNSEETGILLELLSGLSSRGKHLLEISQGTAVVWRGAVQCFHSRPRSRKLLYPQPSNFRYSNLCPEGEKRSGIHPL